MQVPSMMEVPGEVGEEVKLVGAHMSPFVIRAKVALNLKAVRYGFAVEDVRNKSELLLESNPVYKKIPVLIHGDKPVCESMIIVEYIDDVWGTSTGASILPSDPYQRATARFWAAYIDDKLYPSCSALLKAKTNAARAEAIEQFTTGMRLLESAFVKCSQGRGFFGGDTMGYVDIALGPCLGWFRATEELSGATLFVTAEIPNLTSWIERFYAHQAAKDVMLETGKYIELGARLRARWQAQATD